MMRWSSYNIFQTEISENGESIAITLLTCSLIALLRLNVYSQGPKCLSLIHTFFHTQLMSAPSKSFSKTDKEESTSKARPKVAYSDQKS